MAWLADYLSIVLAPAFWTTQQICRAQPPQPAQDASAVLAERPLARPRGSKSAGCYFACSFAPNNWQN